MSLLDMRLIKDRVQISTKLYPLAWMELYFFKGENTGMDIGHFYFIKSEYYIDFPDEKLMGSTEKVDGITKDRPCFYAIYDEETSIYWMIPFSSQVNKYRRIHDDKVKKYKRCDTIVFGEVLGHEKAFLIQNMCPIIPRYIHNEYIDKNGETPVSVKVDGVVEKEIITKAKKVLALKRKGINLIFPDVLTIESALIEQLKATV